jgi:hypothetical protein
MRVNIEFEGSSTEFEQFCETPQRMTHQIIQMYYKGLVAHSQPLGLPQAQPPLLSGHSASLLPEYVGPIAAPTGNDQQLDPLISGLLPPIAVSPEKQLRRDGWRLPKLTPPLQCFLGSALLSMGIVVWARIQPPLMLQQGTAPVLGKPKVNVPTKLPPLPLIPRPGEKRP